jgi:hypothetical protein
MTGQPDRDHHDHRLPVVVPADLIRRYADALNAIEFELFHQLWDVTAAPFYVVEELHDPLCTWADVEHQFARLRARILVADVRVDGVETHVAGPDLVLVYATMRWRYVTVESPHPRHGDSRVIGVGRRATTGWYLVALTETPIHLPPD